MDTRTTPVPATGKTYRTSQQRNRILDWLRCNPVHPTARQVYDSLKPQIPTLSLGNLYRNLGILVEQGQVRLVRVPGSDEDRFDGNPADHCHFCCTSCGTLHDLDMPGCMEQTEGRHPAPGFLATRVFLYMEGLCPDCSRG